MTIAPQSEPEPESKRETTDAQAEPVRAEPAAEAAEDEVTRLQRELDQARARADQHYASWQRSAAEFVNFRRRTEQERAQARELASRALLAQLLPVVDDFARALEAIPADQRETPWVQGIALIESKLWGVLERQGVSVIEALGQPFDPAEHEAIARDEGSAADTVVEIYQPGYRLGSTLLRPAMVKVGAKPPDETGVATESNGGTSAPA